MIERRVDISQSGHVWILLAGFALGLYILWQLSNSLVGGSLKLAGLLLAAFGALFVVAKITRDWRSGVYYFFSWLLFEDLVRKYMGNNMYVYFTKDLLVGITYGSFLVSRMRERTKPFHPPFRFALVAFVIFGFVQVLNPLSPSIFYGLLGLKLYFSYVPLMFVGYAMFQDVRDLPRFFAFNMALAGLIALIGIIQTTAGLNFLNPRTEGSDIDELGHMTRFTHSGLALVRAPSVFVSEGRFQAYMFVAIIIGLAGAAFLLLRSSRRARIYVFPGLGLVTIGAIMTGSRGVVVYVAATMLVLAAAMLWGAPRGKAGTYRLVKAIRRGVVFVTLALALGVALIPESVIPHLIFYQETLSPTSEYSEVGNRTWDYPAGQLMVALSDPSWVTGHGIGTASLGVQYVKHLLGAPGADIGVENGFGVLILEFGILGPILWIFWAGSLVVSGLKVALQLKGTWAFPIAISVVWFAFILLFPNTWGSIVIYQNFVTCAYFWLMVGILFRLPELVKQNVEEEMVAPAQAS